MRNAFAGRCPRVEESASVIVKGGCETTRASPHKAEVHLIIGCADIKERMREEGAREGS